MAADGISNCYEALGQVSQLDALDERCRAAIVVDSAVGIIGNGGFRYFFEMNFPNDPDYSLFADAFRRVGLPDIAERFACLIGLFPFAAPHASPELRQRFLSNVPASFDTAMTELENLIWDLDTEALLARFLDSVED